MTALSSTAADVSERRFPPSLSIQHVREVWENLSNSDQEVVTFLDKHDAEVCAACSMDSKYLQPKLNKIYTKMGFHHSLTPQEKREAAYAIYESADLVGHRPDAAKAALIIFAFTGEKVEGFVDVTDEPPARIEEIPKPDEEVVLEEPPKDPEPPIESPPAPPEPEFSEDEVAEEASHEAAETPQIPPQKTVQKRAPTPMAKAPELPIPADEELQFLIPGIAKLRPLQRTLLKVVSENGQLGNHELAEVANSTHFSVAEAKGKLAKALGIVVPEGLEKLEAAKYKLGVSVRIWELSQGPLAQEAPPPAPPLEPEEKAPEPEVSVVEEIPAAVAESAAAPPEFEDELAEAVFEEIHVDDAAAPPEAREVSLPALHTEYGDRDHSPGPAIVTKANLDIWSLRGFDKAVLDSTDPAFQSDLENYLSQGYQVKDGDNVISPDSKFEPRVLLTLIRQR